MAKKRSFRTVGGGAKVYRPWKQWDVEDYILGVYEDKEKDNYKKNNYVLKVEELYFQDEDAEKKVAIGALFGLNANGALDKVMESGKVKLGDCIKITYNGMAAMGKGNHEGEQAHSLLIEVAGSAQELEADGSGSETDSLSDDDDL